MINSLIKKAFFLLFVLVLASSSCKKDDSNISFNVISPSNGQEFNAEDVVLLSIETTGIDQVSFCIDSRIIASDNTTKFTYFWKTDSTDIGEHIIDFRNDIIIGGQNSGGFGPIYASEILTSVPIVIK
jgi:hypothetical protein